MTGCYQTHTGAHQHRTWEWHKHTLAPPIPHVSQWFRDSGYLTCNLQPTTGKIGGLRRGRLSKIDLNFFLNDPEK